MLRRGRIVLGIAIIGFGLLGVAVGLLAFADPVSAKMADDSDPLGEPPSRLAIAGQTLGFGVLGTIGVVLAVYPPKKR